MIHYPLYWYYKFVSCSLQCWRIEHYATIRIRSDTIYANEIQRSTHSILALFFSSPFPNFRSPSCFLSAFWAAHLMNLHVLLVLVVRSWNDVSLPFFLAYSQNLKAFVNCTNTEQTNSKTKKQNQMKIETEFIKRSLNQQCIVVYDCFIHSHRYKVNA